MTTFQNRFVQPWKNYLEIINTSFEQKKISYNIAELCSSLWLLDVLWGQLIKLVQVASTSELRENQRNNLLFFELFPVISAGPQKYKQKIGDNYLLFNIQKS